VIRRGYERIFAFPGGAWGAVGRGERSGKGWGPVKVKRKKIGNTRQRAREKNDTGGGKKEDRGRLSGI